MVVRGVVSDDEGQNEYLTSFLVNEIAPTITLSGAATSTEGQDYSLTVTTSDPGVGDTITAFYVDWGDGGDLQFFADNTSPFQHVFADNSNGPTTITVFADDAAGRYEASQDVTVGNIAADLQNLSVTDTDGTGVLVEGSTASLTGDIVDPALLDSFTLTVTWGDGEQDVLELSAGTTEFDIVHRYVDDGAYNIAVALVDDDGEGDTGSTSITAINAAPELAIALEEISVDESESTSLSGTITDVGVHDSHTVLVDWGDGTVESLSVAGNAFFGSHQYVDDAIQLVRSADLYAISVTTTDTNDANQSRHGINRLNRLQCRSSPVDRRNRRAVPRRRRVARRAGDVECRVL